MEANGVMLNNMPKIKRNRCFIIVGLLALLSCGEQKHQIQQTIFADDFLLDDSFLMFSDTPPNPLVASDLLDYKNLGMNVMLLTEDFTPMVDSSGNLTDNYKNSIQAIGDAGLQCWIRNMYNDPDYFDCGDPEKERSNYGTPYSLTERHLTDEFKEFPSVTGFYMSDEPYQLTRLPFDYNEIRSIVLDGIKNQNSEMKSNNELATFWDIVSYFRQEGKIWNGCDYRIDLCDRLKCSNHKSEMVFTQTKRVLYLRYSRIFQLYKMHGRQVNEVLIPPQTLTYYLETSPAYLGKKKSWRYKIIINGVEQTEERPDPQGGFTKYVKKYGFDQVMCFDYDKLVEAYNINLEDTVASYNSDDTRTYSENK